MSKMAIIAIDRSRPVSTWPLYRSIRPIDSSSARAEPSGRAALDEPDGRGDEQRRQRQQPASLDPLERPEPAGRLVAGPHRVPVLNQARPPSWRSPGLPGRGRRGGAELVEDVARGIA